ncbi:MAG TPA: hypothetical protein VF842_10695 [Flavobacterium sp.]
MFNKANYKEWFDRYKYAEIAATSAALLSSQFGRIFSSLTTAYLITFAEYFAFYTVIIVASYRKLTIAKKQLNQKVTLKETLFLAKNLVLEFGYPAILDFFFIRPFCMYWMPILVGNFLAGIILGKIASDLFFYLFSIINYELIKQKK